MDEIDKFLQDCWKEYVDNAYPIDSRFIEQVDEESYALTDEACDAIDEDFETGNIVIIPLSILFQLLQYESEGNKNGIAGLVPILGMIELSFDTTEEKQKAVEIWLNTIKKDEFYNS